MLQVNGDVLNEAREDWNRVCSRLLICKETVDEVKCIFSQPGKNAWSNLDWDAYISRIERQIEQCASLAYALETICNLYLSCENHVVEFSEDAIMTFSQLPISFVDLIDATAILQEFSFSLNEEE